MTVLSPNEIAAAIFWNGAAFGPNMSPDATQDASGHIVTHIPKPGSPERVKLEKWLDLAISIALAESGGDTEAHNPGSTATGLWQIMVSVHAAEIKDAQVFWATERANGKTPPVTDPLVNTYVAARLYQQSGWAPWQSSQPDWHKYSGHGKAAYAYLTSPANLKKQKENFLQNMKDEKNLVDNLQAFVPGAGLLKGMDKIGSWLGPILDFIRQGALVVGVFLLGIILLIFGIYAATSKTRAGKSAKKVVKLAAVV